MRPDELTAYLKNMTSYYKKFLVFLWATTAFRLIYAIFLPLAPQEAYYWNYSRHPALSYFDHPPMAAYFIRLSTLLGTSAFSIHLAAILLSIPLAFAIYRLANLLFDDRTAFWSVVAINLTFIYALGSLIITPDNPMLLFWVLVMIACIEIERGGPKLWWLLLGIFLGAGFASKYPILIAGLGTTLFFLSSIKRRQWFGTIWPYLALVAALIVSAPVIYWNYAHHWASFAFQSSRRAGEMSRFRPDMILGYIGTMIGIYGIISVPLLVSGIWNSTNKAYHEKFSNHILIISFSLPLVLLLLLVSTRYWIKMNWTAPAFLGWFIAATAYYFKKAEKSKWVRTWGKASIVFLAVTVIVIHFLALLPNFYVGKGDYYAGWQELAAKVDEVRTSLPGPYVIAGSEYKISSELAFYLNGHPQTLGTNIIGIPGLAYDYWSNTDTLRGYNGIYVYDRCSNCPSYRDDLLKYFSRVDEPERITIFKGGHKIRTYDIYKCYDYLGLNKR
jgi:4-amino-4-deoxy-L-arabinose transferase-like glycosyltransferase